MALDRIIDKSSQKNGQWILPEPGSIYIWVVKFTFLGVLPKFPLLAGIVRGLKRIIEKRGEKSVMGERWKTFLFGVVCDLT